LTGLAITSGDLVITRAKVAGPGARRDNLARALSGVHLGDVVGDEEILLIPKMRSRTRLSSVMPASHFAAGLTAELQQLRRDAIVDPMRWNAQGRAMRFTSHDRYAAWLIFNWLQPPTVQVREMLADLLRGQSMEQWQRRNVLHDGQRIVRLVTTLAAQGLAVEWIKRMAASDCLTASASLGRAFGFRPEVLQPSVQGVKSSNTALSATSVRPKASSHNRSPNNERRSSLTTNVTLRWVAKMAIIKAGDKLADLPRDRQTILLTILALNERPNIGLLFDGAGWDPLAPMEYDEPELQTSYSASAIKLGTRRQKSATALSFEPASPQKFALDDKSGLESQIALHAAPDQVVTSLSRRTVGNIIEAETRFKQLDIGGVVSPEPTPGYRFETQLGGLMFILNILLALGLYPDFSAPLGRRLQPSPFWLLAHLGVALFGKAFRRDPLFGFLNEVGQHGALPRQWRIDPHWLDGVPNSGMLRCTYDGKYLTVRDRRGCIISDSAEKPWSRTAIRAAAIRQHRSTLKLPQNPNERWIACLAAYLQIRIAVAAPGLDVAKLRLPATVTVTDDGVELHFLLAQLPMAVRLAGLDRNPGWLPSEGRNISFHFS
jgi:hypothetical protein